jgi:hypothetical protein
MLDNLAIEVKPQICTKEEYAQFAVDNRLVIFPLIPKTKQPKRKYGHLKQPTTVGQVLSYIKQGGFGIHLGHSSDSPSGIICADFDDMDRLKSVLAQTGGELPETMTTRTPRKGGGLHVFFKGPPAWVDPEKGILLPGLPEKLSHKCHWQPMPGVDFKSGIGLAAGPYSLHHSGGVYEPGPLFDPILPPPAWEKLFCQWREEKAAAIRAAIKPPVKVFTTGKADVGGACCVGEIGHLDLVGRARAVIAKVHDAVQGNRGQDRLYNVTAICRDMGLTAGQALELLSEFNATRAHPPMDESKLQHKIDSVYSKPADLERFNPTDPERILERDIAIAKKHSAKLDAKLKAENEAEHTKLTDWMTIMLSLESQGVAVSNYHDFERGKGCGLTIPMNHQVQTSRRLVVECSCRRWGVDFDGKPDCQHCYHRNRVKRGEHALALFAEFEHLHTWEGPREEYRAKTEVCEYVAYHLEGGLTLVIADREFSGSRKIMRQEALRRAGRALGGRLDESTHSRVTSSHAWSFESYSRSEWQLDTDAKDAIAKVGLARLKAELERMKVKHAEINELSNGCGKALSFHMADSDWRSMVERLDTGSNDPAPDWEYAGGWKFRRKRSEDPYPSDAIQTVSANGQPTWPPAEFRVQFHKRHAVT